MTSHWNTCSTNDRLWQSCVFQPWQSCVFQTWQSYVFLFKQHHIDIPVLLTTDPDNHVFSNLDNRVFSKLDNHMFSCSNNITLKYPFYYRLSLTIVCFPNLTIVCFLVQMKSHWNTRSTNDRPWQSCVFLFKCHYTELPVLLSTDFDNRAFSCSDDITLNFPFYYRLTLTIVCFPNLTIVCFPNLTIMCFLVQTTSHWSTRSTIDRPSRSWRMVGRRLDRNRRRIGTRSWWKTGGFPMPTGTTRSVTDFYLT